MDATNPVRHRALHRLAALVALIVLSLAVVPSAAAASPDVLVGGSAPVTVSVPMYLDCSSVPATAQATSASRRFGTCGGAGIATTTGTNTSNCGSLSLTVANAGNGFMQWRGRITSSLGPFMGASYGGTWSNLANGRQAVVTRSTFGFSSVWSDIFPANSGAGPVFGMITAAAVQLWWGPWCTSSIPVNSFTNVT